MDPPYVGTTGYASDLPRAEVVRIAREWADAGADVYISEAEPIPELVADGWHKFDISSTRRGQKRTFSKQLGYNCKAGNFSVKQKECDSR